MDPLHSTVTTATNTPDISTFLTKSDKLQRINQAWRLPESQCVQQLLDDTKTTNTMQQRIQQLALQLSQQLREQKHQHGKPSLVQGLLQQFSLSSQEGIALMCLAEALLRIPDQATRDLLIRDKINQGNWQEHIGQSQLLFVNAAAWGLMLTGKLMQPTKPHSWSSILTRLIERSGRGIIRKAVDVAMRMMGEQFVAGETIAAALKHAQPLERQGFRYSYDMLGEAALTAEDAQRYFQDYRNAIEIIGQSAVQHDVYSGPGISIKLSALHPRYHRAQIERVQQCLYPKIVELACLAQHYNIAINIDAEESERLEISLLLLERLCFEPALQDFRGIGFVIQAYQKRCVAVVDYLIDLAKRSNKKLMIRLVKGAYWDSEIKKAQIEGLTDFPVFTRKAHSDLSYLCCAQKLLAVPDHIYPQFATHNAHTVASIYEFATACHRSAEQYEFQCLHGMGEALYRQVVGSKETGQLGVPCRIYAPVGQHKTLLAYLVRRLLENGANTSFVNRIADPHIAIESLIEDPRQSILLTAQHHHILGQPHQHIANPQQLYGTLRPNAKGFDLNNDHDLQQLNQTAQQLRLKKWHAYPMGKDLAQFSCAAAIEITHPANHQEIVGTVQYAQAEHIEKALDNACKAAQSWREIDKDQRAKYLIAAATQLESNMLELMVLLCRESGKTYGNAVAEIREAIDFLRYYAAQIQALNTDTQITALGPVLCISPWNFPLAIFIGQISAALVAGNPVIAKPAEQTPLIAAYVIQVLWDAGIPDNVLQMLPGTGENVAAKLSNDPRIQAIMFTGSTEVGKLLQQTVAQRVNQYGQPVGLIAETGGQNAMIIDSSALPEQAVIDIIQSAFDSAGQRCSALRLLCIQEEHAACILNMLKGAMQQLSVGQPYYLSTDIGPVIDHQAQKTINTYIEQMRNKGFPVQQYCFNRSQLNKNGSFIFPTLIELPSLNELHGEIFGPVLHVITYPQQDLKQLLNAIHQQGYGLTMGLHTRIDEHIELFSQHAKVGNLYINRNMVGAVVGVQPFGGEGLSGTGPKAGGPLYLYRLMQHCSAPQLSPPFAVKNPLTPRVVFTQATIFQQWVAKQYPHVQLQTSYAITAGQSFELPGPTGERNIYRLAAATPVLCIAQQLTDLLHQINAILSLGSQVLLLDQDSSTLELYSRLPQSLLPYIHLTANIDTAQFAAILHHGDQAQLITLQQQIAQRDGAIIQIVHYPTGQSHIATERFLIERVVSINSAAAGGNSSLMTMTEQ